VVVPGRGERPPGKASPGDRTPEGCQDIMLELRLAFGTYSCTNPYAGFPREKVETKKKTENGGSLFRTSGSLRSLHPVTRRWLHPLNHHRPLAPASPRNPPGSHFVHPRRRGRS
jgi:hypothetical protein